jgi:beta-lactamase superfamily II metal-dependent hydrolase
MRILLSALTLAVAAVLSTPATAQAEKLNIWFIDVEGGAATLLVTPAGESVLIDCGNPGARDAERIHKVATTEAGLKAIDHLIITHWHLDHYGGVGRLAKLLPIHHYYDRGVPATLSEDKKNFPLLIQTYKEAAQGKSKALKPGDEITLKQKGGDLPLRLLCLCGGGEVVADKPGAAENLIAKEHKAKADDPSDNAKSLGFLLTYGPWRFLDLGDLTWNIEHKLVHPTDKIGPVDVFQVTHHGQDSSNNPVVVKTVNPRVAIHNNGARKGAHASVQATLRRLPEIKAIYQLHRNLLVGAAENTDPEFIANPDEKCKGESIRLSVAAGGASYQITVGTNGKPREYATRGTGK